MNGPRPAIQQTTCQLFLALGIGLTGLACDVEPGILVDPGSDTCGGCHPGQHAAWAVSGHAASMVSPVFLAMLPHVEASWGADARDTCVGCHQPDHGPDHAIGCVSCHAAVGNREERDGLLLVDLGLPVAGPFSDPVPTAAHGSRQSDLVASPSLCGTCHEVSGPRHFVEQTLTEYRASPAAAAGETCATCHFPRTDVGAAALGGPTDRPLADHRAVGFAPVRLASALTLELSGASDGRSFDVRLTNTGAGHHVPTGVSFLRDIYVDVILTDATGAEHLTPRAIDLRSHLTRDGYEVALATDADQIVSHALAPEEAAEAHIGAPAALVSPIRAEAVLRAREIRKDALLALDLGEMLDAFPVQDVVRVAR